MVTAALRQYVPGLPSSVAPSVHTIDDVLVFAAHPQLEHSRVLRTLMRAAALAAPGRTEVRDL